MPADYAGTEETHIHAFVSGEAGVSVPIVLDTMIMGLYTANPDAAGRPQFIAEQPLRIAGAEAGQRKQLYVYPEADQAYSLRFKYYLLPNYLTGQDQNVYGGAQYGHLYLAAARATYEQEILDKSDGPQEVTFGKLLVQCVLMDARNKAKTIGYNGDRSDGGYDGLRRFTQDPLVTFAGTDPTATT